MNRFGIAALLTAALGTLALAATTYRLNINGRTVAGQTIVVNGQTYVPLRALQAAGIRGTVTGGTLSLTLPGAPTAPAPNASAPGGANQLAALQGCVNQTLFNGVWRFRVTGVQQGTVEGQPDWLVGVELRNGTSTPQSVYGTGLSNTNEAYTLATANGHTDVWAATRILNDFAGQTVPQAGLLTYTFRFSPAPSATPAQLAQKPTKFIMRVNTQYVNRKDVPYSVPDPCFRVDLTCTK